MADVGEVGGKAGGLGDLLAEGVRVPDGVVLTAGATRMTADERRSLLQQVASALGGGRFAVRSSGVAEDGKERSYAGMYETVLDVPAEGLEAAIDRVLASAGSARASEYGPALNGRMAVIIQRMVQPAAAGVALTADPIDGDRRTCVVTAVRGTGERLVSGAALGDEWIIRDNAVTSRRRPERAIDARQATRVATEARRIADARGVPQDIEWAIDADGALWIVQARPMTALPPDVSWDPPVPGAYTRAFRFGEWISDPVTPLFESWLLTAMEDRMHALLDELLGERDPRPYHVVVNGWYYYSLNWMSVAVFIRNAPRMFRRLIRSPRTVAALFPPTVRHSVPILERAWRDDLLPRYRAAVASAEARVDTVPIAELPELIDELAAPCRRVLHLDRRPGGWCVQDRDQPGALLSSAPCRFTGRQPPPARGGLQAARRVGTACRRVARLVVRTGSDPRTTRKSVRPGGRGSAGGRGRGVSGPGRETAPPPRLPSPARRHAAPRSSARGAGARPDPRLAGHAARGAAHRGIAGRTAG